MNYTLDELKKDKLSLEHQIVALLVNFESKYGEDLLSNQINFDRYNGSNHSGGKIWKVDIRLFM